MSKSRTAAVLIVSVVALWLCDVAFAQCAMCRGALECSLEGRQLARGLGRAILSLLIAPFFLLGTFGFLIYRIRNSSSRAS